MAASMRLALVPKKIYTPKFGLHTRSFTGLPKNIRNVNYHQQLLRPLHRRYAAEPDMEVAVDEDTHNIIKESERINHEGEASRHEFQAETKKLLDIVAKSLYSEKEVFVRELISNSSDALEKLRHMQQKSEPILEPSVPLEIHIQTNPEKKTITIQDTGIGMTKEDLMSNLGTIARSGSQAFLEEIGKNGEQSDDIIGKFGVGFYSSFMAGHKIEVYSQSHKPAAAAHHWSSDGLGLYKVAQAEGVSRGTKIIVHLRDDSLQFAKEEVVKDIIVKYSNFVNAPIYLNGKRANTIDAIWCQKPAEVSTEQHEAFYQFITKAYDKPRYKFHFHVEGQINVSCLFYVPNNPPSMLDQSRDEGISGVSLYSRKTLIQSKVTKLIPTWLRFLKGIVDSENVPLNLSRELLQDSVLLRRIRDVITNKVVKLFQEEMKRNPMTYEGFYRDYFAFLKEGIITEQSQPMKETISKLMLFDSSKMTDKKLTTLPEYCERMRPGQRSIFFLSAPSRELAESSPYFESLREDDFEVLFCYDPYDDLTMMQLKEFDRKTLQSVENENQRDEFEKTSKAQVNNLSKDDEDALLNWLGTTLSSKIHRVRSTNKLESHPALVTLKEMAAARHFIKTNQMRGIPEEERVKLLQPTLEVNCSHPLIKKLSEIKYDKPDVAKMLAEQIVDNAFIAAGLIEDPRGMLTRLNSLLVEAFSKF